MRAKIHNVYYYKLMYNMGSDNLKRHMSFKHGNVNNALHCREHYPEFEVYQRNTDIREQISMVVVVF